MKDLVVNVLCTVVLAPILAFGLFAVSWWGTAPATPDQPVLVDPHNHNATGSPPGTVALHQTTIKRPVSGRVLFLANCATCHGADGSGHGELVLDRPARSFKEGGFSFGNTIESIERVIASGIPGTPMPGFKATLDLRARVAVARHVQSLGPPIVRVDPDDTILKVTDRPQVVRGELAPLGPTLPTHVRGLIAGGTDGLSWEYRTDDVRLLAVRQGAFVKRENWHGRSGDPLRPLGRIVHLIDGGQPGPAFFVDQEAVVSRLAGTSVTGAVMTVRQRLTGDIRISESGTAATHAGLAGFGRRFEVSTPARIQLGINLNLSSPAAKLGTDQAGVHWYRSSGPDGLIELTGVRHAQLDTIGETQVASAVVDGQSVIEVFTLPAPQWTQELESAVLGRVPEA